MTRYAATMWSEPGSKEIPVLPGLVEPAPAGLACRYGTPSHGAPAEHVLVVGSKRIPYCAEHTRHMLDLSMTALGHGSAPTPSVRLPADWWTYALGLVVGIGVYLAEPNVRPSSRLTDALVFAAIALAVIFAVRYWQRRR